MNHYLLLETAYRLSYGVQVWAILPEYLLMSPGAVMTPSPHSPPLLGRNLLGDPNYADTLIASASILHLVNGLSMVS